MFCCSCKSSSTTPKEFGGFPAPKVLPKSNRKTIAGIALAEVTRQDRGPGAWFDSASRSQQPTSQGRMGTRARDPLWPGLRTHDGSFGEVWEDRWAIWSQPFGHPKGKAFAPGLHPYILDFALCLFCAFTQCMCFALGLCWNLIPALELRPPAKGRERDLQRSSLMHLPRRVGRRPHRNHRRPSRAPAQMSKRLNSP